MPNLVLADTHLATRDALCETLELHSYVLVGVAEDGAEALRLTWERQPDVLALDLDTPHVDIGRIAGEIARRGVATRVALLGGFENGASVLKSFQCGVAACVHRARAGTELVCALDQLARGHRYLSPGIAHRTIGRFLHENAPDDAILTQTETEILRRIVCDVTQHEIAKQMDLSKSEVDRHYASIKSKLHASHIGSLVRHAVRHNLLGPFSN